MKVNQNGDSIWKHNYHLNDDPYHDYFFGFQETLDSGFIITGICNPGDTQSVWLLKLNKYGCDSSGCSEVTGTNQIPLSFSISIYPNPAYSKLNVMIDLLKNDIQKPTFIFSNVLGQTISFIENSSIGNEYNFDVSNLPAGIYFLTVKTNEVKTTEKFVKE